MDQSGAPPVVSLSCDINTGKNQSDCTNCLKCLRISIQLLFYLSGWIDQNEYHNIVPLRLRIYGEMDRSFYSSFYRRSRLYSNLITKFLFIPTLLVESRDIACISFPHPPNYFHNMSAHIPHIIDFLKPTLILL